VAESTIIEGKGIATFGANDLCVGDRRVNLPFAYSGGRGEP
jgi:hypothetical protein